MQNIKKFISVLLCVCIVVLCGCAADVKQEETSETEKKNTYSFELPTEIDYGVSTEMDSGVSIEDIYLYSGEYVEDASFENCENVVALKVKNDSDTDIQLIRINITTDSKELKFEITTLDSGATVVVLEKSRQTMAENEKIISIDFSNRVDFDEKTTLKEDLFLVQGNLSTINIKNISETDIQKDIYVYYKKKDADGNYFGGITFRVKAEGLKPGEIKQLPAANFDPSNSEVLFVDYAD